MSKRKRIAIITTWFPPKNGVAVNRMKAFAEYLSKDFDVSVFSEGEYSDSLEEKCNVHYLKSAAWGKWIKHSTNDSKPIHHLKSLCNVFVAKLGMSPFSSWKNKVLESLERENHKHPFDVVISSFSPVEPLEVGMAFKKKFPKLKWIVDFRDGFSNNPNINEHTRRQRQLFEKEINEYVDVVTTVSEPLLKEFKQNIPEAKFYQEIRNGYNHSLNKSVNRNDIFTIGFSGTLYGLNKPDIFFKVLNQLIESKQLPEEIKLKFVGTSQNFSIPIGLKSKVEFLPKVPYNDAIHEMSTADVNLLLLAPVAQKGIYSGKLFDYLSVEKPILAMIDTNDVAAELIREHKAGFVADFYNETEIAEVTLQAYQLWEKKEALDIDKSKTERLHRKYQVEKLSNLIHQILAE